MLPTFRVTVKVQRDLFSSLRYKYLSIDEETVMNYRSDTNYLEYLSLRLQVAKLASQVFHKTGATTCTNCWQLPTE